MAKISFTRDKPSVKRGIAMKRCAHCHEKLGLGVRSRNLWNGRWWVHVLYCSTHCEAIQERERYNARDQTGPAHHTSQQSAELTERDLTRDAALRPWLRSPRTA